MKLWGRMRSRSQIRGRHDARLSFVVFANKEQRMERLIQLLDEMDEIVVLLRYGIEESLRRIIIQPAFLAIAIAGTLLPG